MEKVIAYGLVLCCAYLIASQMGCSGLEIGGSLGVYRVDTHKQASETYHKPTPWICYFKSCESETKEVEGS